MRMRSREISSARAHVCGCPSWSLHLPDCGPQAQPWVPRFPFSLLLVHLGRWHGMAQVPGPCTLMGDLGGILGYWLCFVPALAAMGIWGMNLRIEKLSVSSSAFLQIPKEQAV